MLFLRMQRYEKEVKSEGRRVKSLWNYILLRIGGVCNMLAEINDLCHFAKIIGVLLADMLEK